MIDCNGETVMKMLALAGLIGASPLPALAAEPAPLAGTRLDISATGESLRTPDIATIGAGVVTQAPSASQAMSDNAARMAATLAALRRAGIADRDIQTASIGLSPQYRYADNQPPVLTGYQASNQLSVRFRDVGRAGALLDALVAAGANQINGPNFAVDRPDAALDEARTAALAEARARAELYARAAGLSVKRIVSIREGEGDMAPRPMAAMALRAQKAADTGIKAGEQTLSVTLSVTFQLE